MAPVAVRVADEVGGRGFESAAKPVGERQVHGSGHHRPKRDPGGLGLGDELQGELRFGPKRRVAVPPASRHAGVYGATSTGQ
jgi:hypothetical protein